MKSKRVLVTGASGFIGSHLVHRLLSEGARVCVLIRRRNKMCNERLQDCWEDLEMMEADVRNRGALAPIRDFAPELVFHLAAYNHVGDSFTQVEECFDVNAKGTANVIDASLGAEKIIYMSTSEVYGHQTRVPFTEDMTPEPISPYSITKYAGELYCRMKQREGGPTALIALRPFNTYGPYQSPKAVISELISNCLTGLTVKTTLGEQTREFNYIDDTIEGLILAAKCNEKIEGALNLGSGAETPIRDLVQKIAELTKTKSKIEIGALPYRPTEIWRMYTDSSRARSLLGWKPTVDVDQGLRRTVEWFREYMRPS